ncbi:glycosyltransferase family 2 protein [Cellulomonas biazotea]|jgi:glycosyltransferase involved in cell wall biosynthesis|uniref:Glycosyl transferase family 2 n=1 Tax=Cellulomonas biazotea TaxID=1709 RepID=A0A402DU96_9CELL|nr:glycosyltransferase family 2 protein [Cellulomonas biazotea]GCE77684.1 glycosyl transferase family 2 [Cellulomonas biazotea]
MQHQPPRRLLAIVPAWNEQATIASVVAEVRRTLPDADVLVVNDGSTDDTSAIARAAGATVLDLPVNLGVGGAMRAGYTYAYRADYDRTVQLDADGQHDPGGVAELARVMDAEAADIVIGARFAGVGDYTVRGPRRWTMRLLSAVLSRVTGTRLTDTTSGLKLCARPAIRLFTSNYPAEYLGDTIESIVIASRAGLRIRQVGVAMRPRAGGRPSHSPVKAAVFLGRAVLALVVALSRPREPVPGGPDA